MAFILLLAAALSGALGVLAALMAGLPMPMVAAAHVVCGSAGLLAAACCRAAAVARLDAAAGTAEVGLRR